MSYETLDVRVEDRIAWLTLNRPEKLNALTPESMAEIRRFCTEVDDDEGCTWSCCVAPVSARSARAWTSSGPRG